MALAAGFVQGEFSTASEGIVWLRALVVDAIG
jgi:hypothetical protein